MNKHLLLVCFCIAILLADCNNPTRDCLDQFNSDLGKSEAETLTLIVDKIDSVIYTLDGVSYADQQKHALTPIGNDEYHWPYFHFENREEWKTKIRNSGLGNAIWNIDEINRNGRKELIYNIKMEGAYMKAIENSLACDQDSVIFQYWSALERKGAFQPHLVARGAISRFSDENFSHPVIKRILVVELYLKYFLDENTPDR